MCAGIAFKGNAFGPEEAQATMATNLEGTRAVCEAVAPLMPSGGRIVNVCRLAGAAGLLCWNGGGRTAVSRLEFQPNRSAHQSFATTFSVTCWASRWALLTSGHVEGFMGHFLLDGAC